MKKALLAAVLLFITIAPSQGQSSLIDSFTDTYMGTLFDWNICAVPQPIVGYRPAAPGRYPLFIYEAATLAPYNGVDADIVLRIAASQGYVAIAAKYNNGFNTNCSTLANKAYCLFSPTAQSAISKGCVRADCSKGIVLSGMSQGSQLGVIAANYDNRIRAVWTQGVAMSSQEPLDSCLSASTRVLPANRLRVINGEHDVYMPDSSAAEAMTLAHCDHGVANCLRADGSGWYRVQDNEVTSGYARHVFFMNGFLSGVPDPRWLPPNQFEWSIPRNLAWLSSFVTP